VSPIFNSLRTILIAGVSIRNGRLALLLAQKPGRKRRFDVMAGICFVAVAAISNSAGN
jgi:hypothetical protein